MILAFRNDPTIDRPLTTLVCLSLQETSFFTDFFTSIIIVVSLVKHTILSPMYSAPTSLSYDAPPPSACSLTRNSVYVLSRLPIVA